MHLKLVSLTILIIILLKFIKCDVADETEDRLSKFRDDINQISVDFENFVYDILKEVFSGTDSIVNPQRNFLKMMKYPYLNRNSLKNVIHKYAVRDTTTKPSEVDNYLDDYLEKTQNLLKEKTNKLLKKNRIKRSTNCEESTSLEKQHLEDLKVEIKKLNNLISTLKNQHKTITTLNSTPKFIQENITRSTHEELEQIKFELQETVAALNETRDSLQFERNRERELEAELNRQRIELNIVKNKLEGLLNRTNEEEVVGEVLDFNSPIKVKERSSDLDALIKELEKKKKEENLKKLVKSLMNDDRKKVDSKIESKSDDEDLELELEKLEEAIDNLQPKDDFGGSGKDNPGSLTRRQINELRKRLEQISKANSFNGNAPPYYNFDRRGFGLNPYFYPPYPDPPMFRPQFLPNYRKYQVDPKFFPPQSGVYTTDNSDGTNQNQSGAYSETNSQYKSIEELRTQVDNLQNIINSLSYSSYNKPEDQQTIAGLEQQINELKNVINSLSQDQTYNQPTNTPYTRRKRSTYSSDKDLLGEITSRFKRYLFQPEVGEIQGKIDEIKLELGKLVNNNNDARNSARFSFSLSEPKKDLISSVVVKIINKIIELVPVIIEKLFGYSFNDLTNFGDDGYGLKKLFKNLGVFGYFPMIVLKIIDGFTTFLTVLRKNQFFKNFLIPAGVLLIVAGSVIFLIWWLSLDSNYQHNNYYAYPQRINYVQPKEIYKSYDE